MLFIREPHLFHIWNKSLPCSSSSYLSCSSQSLLPLRNPAAKYVWTGLRNRHLLPPPHYEFLCPVSAPTLPPLPSVMSAQLLTRHEWLSGTFSPHTAKFALTHCLTPGLCLVSSYQPWCLVCPRRLLSSGCRFRGWGSSDSYLVIGASQPRLMKAVEHLGEARHGREITQTIRPYSTGKETLFYPCSNLKIYVSILKFDKSHTKSLIPGFLQKSEALAVWTQSLW